MDPRLLNYYNRELQFMREMGAEFALEYPKIAGRLGMDTTDVQDPYVERLLEGFAFLAARVQLRLDAEFPRFTQHLLEMVYPHYLAQLPSMVVAQFDPLLSEGALANGYEVSAGSVLKAPRSRDQRTACEYRTGHPLTLWPLELTEARYFNSAGALGTARVERVDGVRAGVLIGLRATAGVAFNQLPLDRLPVFLPGNDDRAGRLYEQIVGNTHRVLVRPKGGAESRHSYLPATCVQPVGFADEEALLPPNTRSFGGYRYLQEYFAFPQRFRFFALTGLQAALAQCEATEIEVLLLFDRRDSELERNVDADCFALHCTPAINLFEKRTDRVQISERDHEYHLVADRTRPLDYEIWSVDSVRGYGAGTAAEVNFEPLYGQHRQRAGDRAYFMLRRQPRMLSSSQRRKGTRTGYLGSETFLSLVDESEAPFPSSLRYLEATTLCTNRDLPLLFSPAQGVSNFTFDAGGPISAVRCLAGPTRPQPTYAHGDVTWRLISHLSLNYLSLTDAGATEGGASLREMLSLYALDSAPANQRLIDGIKAVESRPISARLPIPGPASYGRGLEIKLLCEEGAFEGSGLFLFGQVMEAFFSRYVSTNSFTETILASTERGEIKRWPARIGHRQAL